MIQPNSIFLAAEAPSSSFVGRLRLAALVTACVLGGANVPAKAAALSTAAPGTPEVSPALVQSDHDFLDRMDGVMAKAAEDAAPQRAVVKARPKSTQLNPPAVRAPRETTRLAPRDESAPPAMAAARPVRNEGAFNSPAADANPQRPVVRVTTRREYVGANSADEIARLNGESG